MTQNIYAPPMADVEATGADTPEYYVVGKRKFFILFIVTMGIYPLYWFYRNWSQIKAADNSDIWPLPRAIFAIFFTHSLFRRIDTSLEENDRDHAWQHSGAASLFVLTSVLSSVADQLSNKGIGSPLTDLASLALLPVAAMALYQGQKAINVNAGDPDGESNASLTGANWAWILVFGLLWMAALTGVFFAFNPELAASLG